MANETQVAEVIAGVVYPRTRAPVGHTRFTSDLAVVLAAELGHRVGRTGGWVFVHEPELRLGEDVCVPDLAAWREDRFPSRGQGRAAIGVVPDWVCEVVSPASVRRHRALKLPRYAAAHVGYAWVADPSERLLEVYRRAPPLWSLVAVHGQSKPVRCAPFEEVELPLAKLW